MGYKLCPKCQLNMIPDEDKFCNVCTAPNISANRTPLIRTTDEPYIFMVYQGKNFDIERDGGYIQAPAKTTIHHWERLLDLKKDDIILHAFNGYIVAVSVVTKTAYKVMTAYSTYKEANRVDCKYKMLKKLLNLADYQREILRYGQTMYSPFNKNGTGNQGYLFVLSQELGKLFTNKIKELL